MNCRHWREIHRLAGARTGLVGAIQRLMVNGKTYQNLAVNVTQHNTEIYDGLPCPSNENPCHNGGVCLPLLNSYLCKCASGYNGLHCEFCESRHDTFSHRWKVIVKVAYFSFFFSSSFNSNFSTQSWATTYRRNYRRGRSVSRVTISCNSDTETEEGKSIEIITQLLFDYIFIKFSISHNISPIKSHVTLASHLVKVLFRD